MNKTWCHYQVRKLPDKEFLSILLITLSTLCTLSAAQLLHKLSQWHNIKYSDVYVESQ